MAESLDDGEFWLPSEFLTDDDLLMDKILMIDGGGEDISPEKQKNRSGFCFPSEFPYGFDSSSVFSSPVDSVGSSSTETESDEEDFLAGLTQQMLHSTLQEVEKSTAVTSPVFASEKPMTWVLSGSPQSTLSEVGSCWSGGSGGSSRGSPNGPTRVSSPPTTPINEKDDAWELLYAAAGQVVRMKMNDEGTKRQQQQNHAGRGLLGTPRKPSPVSIPLPVKTAGAAVFPIPNQGLTQQQLQVNQFHQLKQQQQQQGSDVWGRNGKPNLPPPQQQNHQQLLKNGGASFNARTVRPLGLSSSAWPPLQPQHQNQQQKKQGVQE